MARKVGVYPGTFDPITLGHMDIVARGLKLVDRLIIGISTNPEKEPLFPLAQRVAQVERETAALAAASETEIEVRGFEILLMHFAEEVGAHLIIRGLRAVSDFEYEFQMAGMNAALNPQIETVFLMADAKLQPIASRLVKEIALYGGEIGPFVSPEIATEVVSRVEERRKK